MYCFSLASAWQLGHFLSALFAGCLSDSIGRKKTLLLDTAVFFIGFLLLTFGEKPAHLIRGRIFHGYPLVSQVKYLEFKTFDFL